MFSLLYKIFVILFFLSIFQGIAYGENIYFFTDNEDILVRNPYLHYDKIMKTSLGRVYGFLELDTSFGSMTKDSLKDKSLFIFSNLRFNIIYSPLDWLVLYSQYQFSYHPFKEMIHENIANQMFSDSKLIENRFKFSFNIKFFQRLILVSSIQWNLRNLLLERIDYQNINLNTLKYFFQIYFPFHRSVILFYEYTNDHILLDRYLLSNNLYIFPGTSYFSISLSFRSYDKYQSEMVILYRRKYFFNQELSEADILYFNMNHLFSLFRQGFKILYGLQIGQSPYSDSRKRISFEIGVWSKISRFEISLNYQHFIENYSNLYIAKRFNFFKYRDLLQLSLGIHL